MMQFAGSLNTTASLPGLSGQSIPPFVGADEWITRMKRVMTDVGDCRSVMPVAAQRRAGIQPFDVCQTPAFAGVTGDMFLLFLSNVMPTKVGIHGMTGLVRLEVS